MAKHFRAPIFDTFRDRSPFAGLAEHARKVQECMEALEETLASFLGGRHDEVPALAQKVSGLELEADLIKSNIRNHLPRNVRMPVEKSLFLQALHEQDNILDEAEDAAMWMSMRQTVVPAEVGRRFGLLLAKVLEATAAYQRAVDNLDDVLETGFVRRERDQEKEMIQVVHEKEHETDVLSRELSRLLLDPAMEKEVGSIGVYHLLKLTLQVSKIADHAENAGDRLRAMLAR